MADIGMQNYVEKLVNTVAKTIVEAFENLTIEEVDMYKVGYNKAIDDCINLFAEWYGYDYFNTGYHRILKQLKGGAE